MLAAPAAHDHAAGEEGKEADATAIVTVHGALAAIEAASIAAVRALLPMPEWHGVHSARPEEPPSKPITLSSCRPAADPIHTVLLGEWRRSTHGSSTAAADSTSSSNAAPLTHTYTRPRTGMESMIEALLAHVQSFLSLSQWSLAVRVSRAWSRASRLPSAASHQLLTHLGWTPLPPSAQRTLRKASVSTIEEDEPPAYLLPRLRHLAIETIIPDAKQAMRENWLVWISQMAEAAPLESIDLPAVLFCPSLSTEPPSLGFLTCATRLRDLTFSGEFISSGVISVIPLLVGLQSLRLPMCIMDNTMGFAFNSLVEMDFPHGLQPDEIAANRNHARQLLEHIADHPTLTRLKLMASSLGARSSIDLELLLGDDAPVFTRITHLLIQHISVDSAAVVRLEQLGTHFPSLISLDFEQEFAWCFPELLTALGIGLASLRAQFTSLCLVECSLTERDQNELREAERVVEEHIERLISLDDLSPLLEPTSSSWPNLTRFEIRAGFTPDETYLIDFASEALDTMAECMPLLNHMSLHEPNPVSLAAALRLPSLRELSIRMDLANFPEVEARDLPEPHPRPRIEYLHRVTLSRMMITSTDLGGLLDHLPAIGSLTLHKCTLTLAVLLEYAQFVPLAFHHHSRGYPSRPAPQFFAQPVDATFFESLNDLSGGTDLDQKQLDSRVGGAHLWGRIYSQAAVAASTSASRNRMSQVALIRFSDCCMADESDMRIDLRPYMGVSQATLYLVPTGAIDELAKRRALLFEEHEDTSHTLSI